MQNEEEDGPDTAGLFDEPTGYYEEEKPFSFQDYVLEDGRSLHLRLGHHLWNGARALAVYLQANDIAASLVKDNAVLELGAGAGLPSLVCGLLGARKVVATDYPEAALIDNLRHNIASCPGAAPSVVAESYLWGADASHLTAHVGGPGFDTVLLADLLFNHSEHAKLAATVRDLLAQTPTARALVFFTPYRPWLLAKDLAWFDTLQALDKRLRVDKLFERVEPGAPMFADDPGDETLRKTVFAYEVRWRQDSEISEHM